MSKNVIAVWPDATSEPGTLWWIVSRDGLDADDGADTTDTVKTFDEQADAIEYGTQLARTERKPLMCTSLAGDYSIDEAP